MSREDPGHAGRSGKDFDPTLVKVFVNMLGVYPLGTLVLLNTNEMGLVVQAQEDNELIDRPRVCLLSYSDGEYRKGRVLDLREMDDGTRDYKWTITRTLDPNEYNINIEARIFRIGRRRRSHSKSSDFHL
jgi:hypothetical protein